MQFHTIFFTLGPNIPAVFFEIIGGFPFNRLFNDAFPVLRLYSFGWHDRLIMHWVTTGLIETLSRHVSGGTEEN
jgi:hypothetical protein